MNKVIFYYLKKSSRGETHLHILQVIRAVERNPFKPSIPTPCPTKLIHKTHRCLHVALMLHSPRLCDPTFLVNRAQLQNIFFFRLITTHIPARAPQETCHVLLSLAKSWPPLHNSPSAPMGATATFSHPSKPFKMPSLTENLGQHFSKMSGPSPSLEIE